MTNKCHFCDKKAIGSASPDMDIRGIAFCKKHHKGAYFVVWVAMQESDPKKAKKYIDEIVSASNKPKKRKRKVIRKL